MPGELQFVFSKDVRTSRIAQPQIKTMQAGGYSILQSERLSDAIGNERKIFVFLADPKTDLNVYKELSAHCKLPVVCSPFVLVL